MFSYWLFRFHIYQCTITFCWKFHVINKAWSLVVRFSRSTNSAAKRYNLTPPLTVQADIGRKSRFLPQLRGSRRGFCDSVWYGKTRTLGHRYPTLKKFWTHVHLFLQNTRTWQTDGRTDGHRTTRLCIASRGKNWKNLVWNKCKTTSLVANLPILPNIALILGFVANTVVPFSYWKCSLR